MSKISDEIALTFSKLTKYAVHKEYKVVSNDSFSTIAEQFDGVSVEDIVGANPNVDPLKLQIGQVIVIPEPKIIEHKEEPKEEDLSSIKTPPGTVRTLADLENAIRVAANKEGIPPILFRGLVASESSGNSNSSNGTALGLTQLTPSVRKALGVTDPLDINQNLAGGARWLKNAFKEAGRLKGTGQTTEDDLWIYSLMIYHAGMGAVQKWINAGKPSNGFGQVGPKTIKYPAQVLARSRDPKVFSGYWSKE